MTPNEILIPHLEALIASDKVSEEQKAKIVDELWYVRRRVVNPRDASKDDEPITVGIAK